MVHYLIKNCISGINLMNDQVNIEVVKRTPTQLDNYYLAIILI
jgi:hypothetical protein